MSDIRRTFDILERHKQEFKKPDALAGKENGTWVTYSSEKYVELSNYVSYGLMAMGLIPGDRVAVITNNRPEWNFIDMGTQQAGIINVPVHSTFGLDDIEYILDHAAPKLLIVSDKIIYNSLQFVVENNKYIEAVLTIDEVKGAKHWLELLELGRRSEEEYKDQLVEIKQSIQPNDLMTIIYTSGTTARPKGVMLSHKNMTTNFLATALCHEYDHNHKTISFLPLSHVYERMMNYNFQSKGLSIYYVENLSAIATSIREVHPHIFNSVPRLLEQVYDKFVARGKALRGMKKHIYFWAVRLGNKYNPDRNSLFFKFRLKIADQLIYSKWRNALGGNLQTIVSGGAALQTRLARVFGAAGIQIFEGYGLTETAPVIAVNNQKTKTRRIGTVGPALEGVEVKIADDGEILCKGPNIMLGYYKAPELTEEVIDDEGWFHTGDMGELIDKKFLKITDRKKEMFKLSNGKYISPQVIENKFKESIFIEQLMVVGENEKYASAIISPNFNYLHNWATHYQIIYRDNKELIRNPKVLSKFQQEVNEKNKSLGANEQIKRFRLVADEWSTRSGELSPTLKLKRRFLFRKYDVLLREIYQNLNGQEKNTLSTYLQALQKNVSLPKLNTSLLKDIVRGNQKEEKPE